MSDRVIDLRSLQNPVAGRVELVDGVHDVHRFNVDQYQQALKPIVDPEEGLRRSVQLVAECAPTIPEPHKLHPKIIEAIITLACAGVEAVEKLFPNAPSPEPSTPPG